MKQWRLPFRCRSFARVIRFGGTGILLFAASDLRAQDQEVRRAREAMYQNLTYRQNALNSTLEQLDQTVIEIEQWLSTRGIAPEDLAARLPEVMAERTRLVALVAATEQEVNERLRRLEVDPKMLETVFASNALEITKVQKEIEQLHRELREKPRDVGLQTSVSLAGLSSRPFLLTGDRIAPFDEPYFSAKDIHVRLANRTIEVRRRYERESDAGTIAAAVESGGVVAELVNAANFDPAKTYVTLWVCADAIEGYRAVSEFLKSRGVRYTWTTDVDEPWVARVDGEGFDDWGYESP